MNIFNKINTSCILDTNLGIYVHDKDTVFNNLESDLPKIYLLGQCLFTYTTLTTKEDSLACKLQNMLPYNNVISYSFTYNTLINMFNTIKKVIEPNSTIILYPLTIRHPFSSKEVFNNDEMNIMLNYIVDMSKIKNCKLYIPILKNVECADRKFMVDLNITEDFFDNNMRIKLEKYDIVCEKLINMLQEPPIDYYCDKYADENKFEELIIESQKKDLCLVKTNKKYLAYIKSLENFKTPKAKTRGLVCGVFNPFTKGHLSLIEYAANKVDVLYILSDMLDLQFPYKLRHELMKIGVSHIKNIIILPTCELKNSPVTFGDYINKKYQNLIGATFTGECLLSLDIIKALNITHRILGEEPEDIITNKYIEDFKTLNKAEGNICVIEVVKRIKFCGNNISASMCRKLIHENKFDELSSYIPEKVLERLKAFLYENPYNN